VDEFERKSLSDSEWKSEKPGTFRAVVATYNVVDHDGDVTLPGALDTTKNVLLSAWNHNSTDEAKSDPPVGSATITTVGDKAIVDGKFYIDTELGRRAYEITKSLFEDQLSEWSYGYRVPAGGASTDSKDLSEWPGAQRILRKVTPFEVSLVFAGAGIGTQTLAVKSAASALELEMKRGARLSKESRARLHTLATELLAFIGEAEMEEPKTNDAEVQSFLRSTRDEVARLRSTRLIDLRAI